MRPKKFSFLFYSERSFYRKMSREILIEYNFECFILFYSTASEEIPDSAFCAMLDNPESFPLWEVSTCVFFAFPMMIMVVLYSRMGLKIRSRSRHTLALGKIRFNSPFFALHALLFCSFLFQRRKFICFNKS